LLILLAAMSWSIYFALQKHHARRYDGLMKAPLRVQWAVLALRVFPSALAYLAWGFVLKHLDAEPGDNDIVFDTADGDGDCFGRAGGAADTDGAGGIGGGVDQCVGVESGAAGWRCSGCRGLI
jgi:hypothetical protein